MLILFRMQLQVREHPRDYSTILLSIWCRKDGPTLHTAEWDKTRYVGIRYSRLLSTLSRHQLNKSQPPWTGLLYPFIVLTPRSILSRPNNILLWTYLKIWCLNCFFSSSDFWYSSGFLSRNLSVRFRMADHANTSLLRRIVSCVDLHPCCKKTLYEELYQQWSVVHANHSRVQSKILSPL